MACSGSLLSQSLQLCFTKFLKKHIRGGKSSVKGEQLGNKATGSDADYEQKGSFDCDNGRVAFYLISGAVDRDLCALSGV